jgi:hypothetical protein
LSRKVSNEKTEFIDIDTCSGFVANLTRTVTNATSVTTNVPDDLLEFCFASATLNLSTTSATSTVTIRKNSCVVAAHRRDALTLKDSFVHVRFAAHRASKDRPTRLPGDAKLAARNFLECRRQPRVEIAAARRDEF